jgi:hypothetical protein
VYGHQNKLVGDHGRINGSDNKASGIVCLDQWDEE